MQTSRPLPLPGHDPEKDRREPDAGSTMGQIGHHLAKAGFFQADVNGRAGLKLNINFDRRLLPSVFLL